MRRSREAKADTHQDIVTTAAAILRERGIERTGVADVMKAAGLTHGGFYRHFATKEALLEAALDEAFRANVSPLEHYFATVGGDRAMSGYRAYYVSEPHVANPASGCPIAALGNDVARASAGLKARFGAGVMRLARLLETALGRSPEQRRAQALRDIAMRAGAVMIARASDPATASAVLAACQVTIADYGGNDHDGIGHDGDSPSHPGAVP